MSHTRNRSFHPRLCRLEDRTAPAAGMLDPTFGVGGRMTTRFQSPSDDYGHSTAIDSLGRIVVAGYASNGSDRDFAVARFTPAGALDATFGGTGVVTFSFGAFDDEAFSVAVDSLDRVVVAGYTFSGPYDDFAVARLTAAGALDASFDADGKQTIAFGMFNDEAYGVAVDSFNRVVVVGPTSNGVYKDFAVARLTVGGALDTSFDGDGKQTIAFGTEDDFAYGVAIDSLDRVVIAGYTSSVTLGGTIINFAVARLTTTEALDGSFDGDGRQTIDFASSDRAYGVAVDSLNRVVVAGQMGNGDFAVARLTPAGALDSAFDNDGRQSFVFDSSINIGDSVAVDSLDRPVVAGYANTATQFVFAVARLTPGGALDTSFDGDGKQTFAFGTSDEKAYGVAVDSQDRIVTAGYMFNGANWDFALARLTPAGALDASFDADGKKNQDLNGRSQAIGRSIVVDSIGRTVVAGYASNGSNNDFLVARYTPAGALDTSFGGAGVVSFAFGSSDDEAFSVALDSLDRVIVAGQTFNGTDNDLAVARLTASGALDSGFDSDGKQTIAFGDFNDEARGVAIDSLDRIVIAGATFNGSDYDFAVARFTVAGALDTSFDSDGKQSIAFAPGYNFALGVTTDSLNRVIVAGETTSASGGDFAIARLTAVGALDSSFDGDGRQTISFSSNDDVAFAVAVDSLDRVVVAGHTFVGTQIQFAVARLSVAGALDLSFDGDGKRTITFGTTNDGAYSVAIDSLDRVVVVGSTHPGSTFDVAVARLTVAGALDATFDTDGEQTFDFGTSDDFAYGVAVASADRLVVAGYSEYDGKLFAVARLSGDTTTASAQVNDGSAQRSRVTSLTVRFSGQVTFSGAPADAFTLVRTGGGAVSFTANVSVEYGGTVVVLTNFTGTDTEFGSLRDGRYTFTALASQITAGGQSLDGDADGTPGDDFVFGEAQGLFRFFGDINGDRHVDIADFGLFSASIFNPANYNNAFDFNNDGVIDIADFGQFSIRIFTVLP